MGYTVDKHGNLCTYDEEGRFHSYDDDPAMIRENGSRYWMRHGKYHRENGQPAIVTALGTKYWYEDDKRVRVEYLEERE